MSRTKKHEPLDAQRHLVSLHASIGTPHDTIADILNIDSNTLRKHYRQELDHSTAKANAAIGGALFNKAKGGDTTAMIFWMKTRARWRETGDVSEKTDAPPLTITFNVKPATSDIKVTRGA